MMQFVDQVENLVAQNKTLLCVGLDPDLGKIPPEYLRLDDPIFSFNKAIIDATKDLVCCYKPQIAYYSAIGAEKSLSLTIQYIQKLKIPVILDSKRGDIGDTAKMYAKEAFERFAADAVTVNPYMGWETLQPYMDFPGKGVIVLCKTSNLGSGDLQDLKTVTSHTVCEEVALRAEKELLRNKNILLVVGATHVESLKIIRELAPRVSFLIPGVGAQGGDLMAVLKAALRSDKKGVIVNSSRAIIFANKQKTHAESVYQEAFETVKSMRSYL